MPGSVVVTYDADLSELAGGTAVILASGFLTPGSNQIEVYNMLGQRIATLIGSDKMQAGSYNVTWDARDQFGRTVASGIYIYSLSAGDFTAVRKMTFLK